MLSVTNSALSLAGEENQSTVGGGGGFADSYFQPATLGWHLKRADIMAAYAFFAPTGRFTAGASNNTGSGHWTNAPTAGETFYLTKNKGTAFSAYEMYEFHTTQQGTNIHPGQTFDLDYSLTQILPLQKDMHTLLQVGVVGYGQWQTSNNSGPGVDPQHPGHYRVNGIGGAANVILPVRKVAVGFKLHEGIFELVHGPGILAADNGCNHFLIAGTVMCGCHAKAQPRWDLLLLLSLLLLILLYPVLDHGELRRIILGIVLFVPVILTTDQDVANQSVGMATDLLDVLFLRPCGGRRDFSESHSNRDQMGNVDSVLRS